MACFARKTAVSLEARVRIELTNKGFADLCLTTWLPRLKREALSRTRLVSLRTIPRYTRRSQILAPALGNHRQQQMRRERRRMIHGLLRSLQNSLIRKS